MALPAATALGDVAVAESAPSLLDELAGFDTPRFGESRAALLRAYHRTRRFGLVARRRGRIAGYLIARDNVDGLQVGPFVAEEAGIARALFDEARRRAGAASLTVGVPAPNAEAAAFYAELGFAPRASCQRMVRGTPGGEGRPGEVWGIASGAAG